MTLFIFPIEIFVCLNPEELNFFIPQSWGFKSIIGWFGIGK